MKTYRSTKIISEFRKDYTRLLGRTLPRAPFIRIRGRWLEAAGFNIGDQVNIKVEPGKLTLTKES